MGVACVCLGGGTCRLRRRRQVGGGARAAGVAGQDKIWEASGLLKDRGGRLWEALGSCAPAEAQLQHKAGILHLPPPAPRDPS